MKQWIKLVKHFQGGKNEDYMLIDSLELEKREKQIIQEWGENSEGGHNYGYRVDLFILNDGELPPKKWLEKAVKYLSLGIEGYEDKIKENKRLIIEYKDILENDFV